MRSRCRHRQNAGLPRGLYPLADAPPRTDETAHRYLHFQRCLAGRYPYRVSARPVRYFAGRGYHHRTRHSRGPQGQRAFCLRCPPRRESIAGAAKQKKGNGTACTLQKIFWTWIISRNFPGMIAAAFVCRSPAREIVFCARIAATSNICGIP